MLLCNLFKDYKADKENLFEFLPPKTNRNILAPKSNQLLTINLSGKTISSESAPQEAGGNCTTMQMIDEGPALVIVSDPGIWLFSPTSKYTPLKCDLAEDSGFCKRTNMESRSETYTCAVPRCSVVIHVLCDTTIRGKPDLSKFMCPACRDIDPTTGRKRPRYTTKKK